MQSSPGSGLHNGTFTIFSSDHCPFRYGDDVHGKASGIFEADESLQAPTDDSEALQQVMQKEKGKFRFVPNGIPGVETRLPLLYTGGLQTGRISPQRFVEVTSTNPAKLVSCTQYLSDSADSRSMACTLAKERSCPDPTPTLPL